jgi:hypothetical protein
LIILHYQYLGEYIIRNPRENNEEIQKIMEYMNGSNTGAGVNNNAGVNINRNNTIINSNISSSIRRDDFDRPLRRPTTPMTNLSSTSNSQIFNGVERRSIQSRIRQNVHRNDESEGGDLNIVNSNNRVETNENIKPIENPEDSNVNIYTYH